MTKTTKEHLLALIAVRDEAEDQLRDVADVLGEQLQEVWCEVRPQHRSVVIDEITLSVFHVEAHWRSPDWYDEPEFFMLPLDVLLMSCEEQTAYLTNFFVERQRLADDVARAVLQEAGEL